MSPEEKQIRKMLKPFANASPSKPGDIIKLRDGTKYRVGPKGNWIKIGKDATQYAQPRSE